MPDFRQRVKELIAACPVRHKPDRHPDGQIFEDTAYRLVDGRLASRKRLEDAAGAGASEAKLRKFVDSIAYPTTREAVAKAVEERLARGIRPAHVFDEPILHPVTRQPIRRVFCFADNPGQFEAVLVKKDAPPELLARSPNAFRKHLKHAGYAWLEVNRNTGEIRLVTVAEGLRRKHERPPEGVVRFFKGDTIIHPRDGKRYVVRYFKDEGGGQMICTLVSEARVADKIKGKGKVKITSKRLILQLRLADE